MARIYFSIWFFISFSAHCSELDSFFYSINIGKFQEADLLLSKVVDNDLNLQMSNYLRMLKDEKKPYEIDINQGSKSSLITCFIVLNNGVYYYLKEGNEIKAYNSFKASLLTSKKMGYTVLAKESVKWILELYQRFGSLIGDKTYEYFLKEYESLTSNEYDRKHHKLKSFELWLKFSETKELVPPNDISQVNFESYPFLEASKKIALSAFHRNKILDLKKSEEEIKQANFLLKGREGLIFKERYKAAKINKAIIEFKKNQYTKSIEILKRIEFDTSNYLQKLLKPYQLFWLYKSNDIIGNRLIALEDYTDYLEMELLNDQSRKIHMVSDYETKYQTTKKEKQILEEQQKAQTNRNWLIAASLALILGTSIAILLQKNTTKKRKLAEQQTQLEQQKVATLLKDQELNAIDAMISGQEKERQRVANELHDDLGSLMATVKLHFDNIKSDKQDPALKSASKLLEKAYQKIRGIAHSKNSGLMADQGLLPAVRKMATTISETNIIKITVEDFGLKERMENSLELTLFRIIQELIANTIKHSGATRASIQFTQHEDKLNIIVEDNGQGFDMTKVSRTSKGMGLGTIEKRIEHLEGSFTVDSVLEKGTSVLIDIPI